MNNNLRFILKITGIHILTYILCGIIFSTIFSYNSLFSMNGVDGLMKGVGGVSTLLGPLVQVIRGILFGLVLLLFKDTFMGKKYGWLKLWAILSIIGIINTPEILIQTLLFSYLLAKPSKKRNIKFIEDNKNEFVSAIVCMVLFSLSGIVLAFIKGIDIKSSVGDMGAFGVMFIASVSTFFISKYYAKIESKLKDIIAVISLYFLLGILPYIYNLITNSPFNTNLTLLINIIPTAIVLWVIKLNCKNKK